MGLPTYQIQTCQKALPITKYTNINKKKKICPSNWKTSKLCIKSQQNLKKLLNDSRNPGSTKNGSSNLPVSNVPKTPTHNEIYQHYSKIPTFVLATEKHQKSAEKVNKI